VYANRIKSEHWMALNPIELRKNDHGFENELLP